MSLLRSILWSEMFLCHMRILVVLALSARWLVAHEPTVRFGNRRLNLQNESELRALDEAAGRALTTNPPPKVRRGLSAIRTLVAQTTAAPPPARRAALLSDLAEVCAALQNNQRSPVPRRIDVMQLPFVHYHYIRSRVGFGKTPPVNLQSAESDGGKLDPLLSSFWSRRSNIASQELNVGFERTELPRYEQVWTYAGPKTGYGANAGFEAYDGDVRIKIKFGEVHSEPFAARIFHALGYNVDATDYSAGLKIRYDRRLFAEFNSRKPVNTKITALGVLPVWTIRFQPEHNPFDFIAMAVLKDGTQLDAQQFQLQWLLDPADFESRIDYLMTVPANVQLNDANEKSIGAWDFGQLDHARRRELRGAGLLAAWLGWFDSRFDNTRLRIVKDGSLIRLKHVFADLGGGLGRSTGWTSWRGELPEEFPDHFTTPAIRQGPGKMTLPFRIVNFRPIESTPAFREMTLDDARWMARLIAQLTEQQIVDALRASGFAEREVETFRRKLLSRRSRMLRDLDLGVTPGG
jgi:hypothetical protein